MDQARLLELFDGYLEQRLAEADRAALNQHLAASPDACRLFWQYVHQHAQLMELLAEARGRELAEQEQVLTACPLPCTPSTRLTQPWHRRRVLAWLACAAAVLLVVGLGWLLRPAGPSSDDELDFASPVLARLGELRGQVHILAQRGLIPARVGQVVGPNEEVHTGEDSFAVVTYDDSSRLELNSATAVRLLSRTDRSSAGKHVFLVRGFVNATVAPQRPTRPLLLSTEQADLLASGTRFSSANIQGETRIELEEGKALLARRGEPAIEIHTGTYAIAAPDPGFFSPAPLLPASTKPFAQLNEGAGPVPALAALPGRPELAVGCWNGQVKFWDPHSRKVRGVLDAAQNRVHAMARSRDGRSLAVAYDGGPKNARRFSVMVWDLARRRVRLTLPAMIRTQSLDFTADGQSLVLAWDRYRSAVVWDLPPPGRQPEARERLILGERLGKADCLAVSPDGHAVAVGYRDGKIRLWDLSTGRLESVLEGHRGEVKALAFAPDGQLLASGSRDGTVRLWALPSGQPLRTLTGPFKEVRCLAFSPDGQTLASGHAGVALLWSMQGGEVRSTLKAHKFAITALQYLDEGRTLATAGWDRTVKLWKLAPAW